MMTDDDAPFEIDLYPEDEETEDGPIPSDDDDDGDDVDLDFGDDGFDDEIFEENLE